MARKPLIAVNPTPPRAGFISAAARQSTTQVEPLLASWNTQALFRVPDMNYQCS